jgi:hypothetical protein
MTEISCSRIYGWVKCGLYRKTGIARSGGRPGDLSTAVFAGKIPVLAAKEAAV